MLRILRIVLLWLVALAVPVQGLAAATMLHCGPAHAAADTVGAGPSRGSHVGADASFHVHAVDHQHDDGDAADPDAQSTDADAAGKTAAELHKLSKSSCASCSACCAATALPAVPILLDSPLLAGSVPAARSVSAAVFLTDGPERPPRAFLT